MNARAMSAELRPHARWSRWAIRMLGIAGADFVSQYLRVLIVLWPIDAGDAFLLAVEVAKHGLFLGAAVAAALEADAWLRGRISDGRRIAVLAVTGLTAIVASSALIHVEGGEVGVRLGVVDSQRSLQLHTLWNNAVVGAVAMVYLSRRRETREAEQRRRLDEAKLEQTRRQLTETSTHAAQHRLDPETLFTCLHRARDLYPVDPTRGDELLDRLTRYLRLTLAADATSTLGREAATAAARLELDRADADPGLDVRLSDELARLPFPSGLLTQTVQAWWKAMPQGADRTLRIDARLGNGVLSVDVEGPCDPPLGVVGHCRTALTLWRGSGPSVTSVPGCRPRLHLESPHAI